MRPREQLLNDLASQGWAISDGLIGTHLQKGLYAQCRESWDQGQFRQAGIGHGPKLALDTGIRGDSICWIEAELARAATLEFLQWTEALREDLNEQFYAGLKSTEFHFARYPAGHGYRKHMDQHRGQTSRKISLVLYLNPSWAEADSGELCLYSAQDPDVGMERVLPHGGRLVIFRSDLIPHEVRPCMKTRWSLSGWFRTDAR